MKESGTAAGYRDDIIILHVQPYVEHFDPNFIFMHDNIRHFGKYLETKQCIKLTTFFICRKHPRNMADTLVWESISMSIRRIDNPPPPQAEVHVVVCNKLIKIEYVNIESTVERTRHIDICNIEATTSPTVDSVILALDGREEVTFRFGTAASKGEFIEAITIER
jgi:hypothetical protein